MLTLRRRLARSFARAHRGMTLLEIMIVLAILAVVMGLVVGPRVLRLFQDSKIDTTRIRIKKFAFEAYPSWAASHPDKACPEKLADLNEYMNDNNTNDEWQKPLKLICPPPAGAKGIGVMSTGPDTKDGTEDDLRSWD